LRPRQTTTFKKEDNMCQSTNLSAFDEAMGATVLKHGKLTDREREIAETVARAAYRWALREQVEILEARIANV